MAGDHNRDILPVPLQQKELENLLLLVTNRPGGALGLRHVVESLPQGEEMSAAIAWEQVTPAALAFQAVQVLTSRRAVDDAFVQALALALPSQDTPRVRALAAALGLGSLPLPEDPTPRLRSVADALMSRWGSAPRPILMRFPVLGAPVASMHRTWLGVLLDCDVAGRAVLLRHCWPQVSLEDFDESEFGAYLTATLGACSLGPVDLWNLAAQAGHCAAMPSSDNLDRFIDALMNKAIRTPGGIDRVLLALAAALPPDEALAFEVPTLAANWMRRERERERSRLQELESAKGTLLALLMAERRGDTSGPRAAIDSLLGMPSARADQQTPEATRNAARDLDEAEQVYRDLNPLSWIDAAVRVGRAGRSGLTDDDEMRAAVVRDRVRPRLIWLTIGGPAAWVVLWSLSAAIPIWVEGAVAVPILGWIWRALRPVAIMGAIITAGVGGGIRLVDGALNPDHAARRAAELGGTLCAERPGTCATAGEVYREVSLVGFFALDAAGRTVLVDGRSMPSESPIARSVPSLAGGGTGGPVSHDYSEQGIQVDAQSNSGMALSANSETWGGPTKQFWDTRHVPRAPLTFTGLSKGRFRMGTSAVDSLEAERPAHAVVVSPFLMGRSEVTQAQWEAVVSAGRATGDPEAQRLKLRPARGMNDGGPVDSISWCDAVLFANVLSRLEGLVPAYSHSEDCTRAGKIVWSPQASGFRLPTEAEWEYAARAGTTSAYSFGNVPTDACVYANVLDLTAKQSGYDWEVTACRDGFAEAAPACDLKENLWGFCDLYGNVWEWVWDWYDSYPDDGSEEQDPTGPTHGVSKVLRGGSWRNPADLARATYRGGYPPGDQYPYVGLRLVLPRVPSGE